MVAPEAAALPVEAADASTMNQTRRSPTCARWMALTTAIPRRSDRWYVKLLPPTVQIAPTLCSTQTIRTRNRGRTAFRGTLNTHRVSRHRSSHRGAASASSSTAPCYILHMVDQIMALLIPAMPTTTRTRHPGQKVTPSTCATSMPPARPMRVGTPTCRRRACYTSSDRQRATCLRRSAGLWTVFRCMVL